MNPFDTYLKTYKEAADYYTWGGNTKMFDVRPNFEEVAYLSKHPEYNAEHIERVMGKLRELREKRMYEGYLKSLASNPLERQYADRKFAEMQMDPEKDAVRKDKVDKYLAKWDSRKADKERKGYSKRLEKALDKFSRKYGPGSKHPYEGEGMKIKDTHTNIIYS